MVTSVRAGDLATGVGLFLAYAAGMGLMVGTAAVAVALTRTSVVTRLRRAAPVIARASGLLLILAGAYVAYYGWYEIRVFRGAADDDAVVVAATAIQRTLTAWLDRVGALPIALALTALLAVAALLAAARRVRR